MNGGSVNGEGGAPSAGGAAAAAGGGGGGEGMSSQKLAMLKSYARVLSEAEIDSTLWAGAYGQGWRGEAAGRHLISPAGKSVSQSVSQPVSQSVHGHVRPVAT